MDPVPFGKAIRKEWPLSEETLYLNHGAFGLTPLKVLSVQEGWRRRMEGNPTRFFTRELRDALREAAEVVAGLLGGAAGDWVFVDNATAGVNALLASLTLAPGDEVVVADHCYPAVRIATAHHCQRQGAVLKEAPLPFPAMGDDPVVNAFAAALTARTRLVIVDQVTSGSATLLPVARIARLCRERGVPLLVDGAHGPGMVETDVVQLGADWYAGNLHKWAFAPKGCGVLWARPGAQEGLHPPVISHGYGKGFNMEFDWQGTRDVTAWLSAPAAIAFLRGLGWARLKAYNHALVLAGARRIAERFGTELGAPPELVGFTCAVALPESVASREKGELLMRLLAERHLIEVPVVFQAGRGWLRLSAQVYNEEGDYLRLAQALEVELPRL